MRNIEVPKTKEEMLATFAEWLTLEKHCRKRTIEIYVNEIKQLKDEEITLAKQIDKLATLKRINGNKNSTKNITIKALKAFASFVEDRYEIKINCSFKSFKIDRAETVKFLTMEELEKLKEAIATTKNAARAKRNLLVFTICLQAGLRISEVINLKFEDAFDGTGQIRGGIHVKGKGGKVRQALITKEIKYRLLMQKEDVGSFYGNEAQLVMNPSNGKRLTLEAFFAVLKKAATKAGIDPKNVSPHKLRHSFAVHNLYKGCNILTIQNALGHSNMQTTEIYLKVSAELAMKDLEKNSAW